MKKTDLNKPVREDQMSPAMWENPMLAYDEGFREGFAYGYMEGIFKAIGMKLVPDEDKS